MSIDRSLTSLPCTLALAFVLLCHGALAWATSDTVRAQPQSIATHIAAYARVAPIALSTLHAAAAGDVQGLHVEPGQHVAAGESLGHLSGPEVNALLSQRRSAVADAKATLSASEQILAIEQQQRSQHLSTRQTVYKAKSAQRQAKAQLANARSTLKAAKQRVALRAPASGVLVSLRVADGDRVSPGQTLLTLQPDHQLWLKAAFYGNDGHRIHIGMTGRFIPAHGGHAIPVRVARILPTERPGGGLPVGLKALHHGAQWRSGEAGQVVLQGPRDTGVTIPSRALILYRSQWWVLVDTTHGARRQRVSVGPNRDGHTLITHGLAAGTPVIVDRAYLMFHRDFAQHYQPPD